MRRCGVLVAAALAVAAPASAQTVAPPLQTRGAVETAVLVGSLGTAGLATLISVAPGGPWRRQWLSIDEPVKRNFSPAAARASDVLAAIAILGPMALQLTGRWNGETGQRALVYGETLAANLALNGLTKALVARPRPYTYNTDPAAQAQVEANPRDAHLSFFSGHASTTFAAAVAGAYLYSQSTDDVGARTAVWASSLALAGATSNLRVRAGKHFYSDVLAGAVVGTGVGWLVPALHFGGRDPLPLAPAEWVAIVTAPLAGALASQLVPLPELPVARAQVLPWVTGQGAGVMLAGRFEGAFPGGAGLTSAPPVASRAQYFEQARQAEQRGNREGRDLWDRYALHRQHLTAAVLALAPGGGRLCLLGAGNANDYDLPALADRFEEIHLVDIDPAALARATGGQPAPVRNKLRSHAPVDLSGIFHQLDAGRAGLPDHAQLVETGVADVLGRLPAGFDLVVSACVMSQISWSFARLGGEDVDLRTALEQAMVTIHLRTLLSLVRPGGPALLAADLVSTDNYPIDEIGPDTDLRALVTELSESRLAYAVSNPELLQQLLRRDRPARALLESTELGQPWLWTGSHDRTYLVYPMVLRRRPRVPALHVNPNTVDLTWTWT